MTETMKNSEDNISDIIKKTTKDMSVICRVKDASPVAFLNLFDEGDMWIKIKGCLDCPLEQRIKCCGNCPCILADGSCYWQMQKPHDRDGTMKSLSCIITPLPTKFSSRCCIEYLCVVGEKKGKIRRLQDKLNVFQTPETSV